jgi:hypothetical protein
MGQSFPYFENTHMGYPATGDARIEEWNSPTYLFRIRSRFLRLPLATQSAFIEVKQAGRRTVAKTWMRE